MSQLIITTTVIKQHNLQWYSLLPWPSMCAEFYLVVGGVPSPRKRRDGG